MSDFTLSALHTSPRQTVEELTALTEVVEDIHKKWGTPNILILGDLNADCAYVPKKAWPGIPIRQDSQFWWLIADDVDTTVSNNTNCAYDRCMHVCCKCADCCFVFTCLFCWDVLVACLFCFLYMLCLG